jgi:uncharacterized membrane protein
MAKAAKDKKPRPKTAINRSPTRSVPNWPLFALAVLGMVLTGYLTIILWTGERAAGCTPGTACDIVLNSRWSTLFGFPTSFWGFLTYAALAVIAWNKHADSQWRWAWFLSLFGLLYSIYLTFVSFLALEAACPYCLTSLGLFAATFIIIAIQRPANLSRFSWVPWITKSAVPALAIVVALHLHYAGVFGKKAGPEDPWIRGLAEHLTKTSAKFYGASWCPHCTEQKEMFGSSAHRLPYIECSPGGPKAPPAQVCNQASVKSYPTWVINGQRYTGTQTLENLAQYSQYKGESP